MRHSNRGSVLITVLWVVTVLVILVLGLAFEARSDIQRTIFMRDRAKAYWMARSGVEYAKYDIAASKMNSEDFKAKGFYRYDYTNGWAEVSVESDSAKMPLNSNNREMWAQAFKLFYEDEQSIDEQVDAIMDWLDANDEPNLNGAEADYYLSLAPPYEPRNGPFMSVDELLLVRGITEQMFYGGYANGQKTPGLKDIIGSTSSKQPRLDINSASKEVLMAFLEITEDEAKSIINRRKEELFENVSEAAELVSLEAADKMNLFFMAFQGNQVTIKSTGYVYNSPARYTVQDVARYVGGAQLFVTVAHKDFSLDHAEPAPPEEDE